MRDQIVAIVAAILDLSEDTCTDDASTDTVDAWDSLAHMNIMMALEENFKLKFTIEQMTQMTSIADMNLVLSSLLIKK